MKGIYLGLGSNLGDRQGHFDASVDLLNEAGIKVLRISTVVETEPLKGKDQPKYLNCVIEVETNFLPEDLLKECQKIEDKLGRERGEKWASRTIDIDILLYGLAKIDLPGLKIPHYGIEDRQFVEDALKELGAI